MLSSSCSPAFCPSSHMTLHSVSGRSCTSILALWSTSPRSPMSRLHFINPEQLSGFISPFSQLTKNVGNFPLCPIVCTTNSPISTRKALSLSNSTDKAAEKNEPTTAKERRKMRHERRLENISAQEKPWKEMVEDRLLAKRKKSTRWEDDADFIRCTSKGMQWWMLQTSKTFEFQVAEEISTTFPEKFPGREFEVSVPTLPVKAVLKDGRPTSQRRKLFHGIVLIRCVLDREIWAWVKQIPRAYEFFGHPSGMSIDPMIMPAPVPSLDMEKMFENLRRAEEDFEQFKEQCKIEAEAKAKEAEQQKAEEQHRNEFLSAKGLVLEVGATIKVLTGPYLEFTGIVTELLPTVNKIKVLVTVFGNDAELVLDVEQVSVQAAAPVP